LFGAANVHRLGEAGVLPSCTFQKQSRGGERNQIEKKHKRYVKKGTDGVYHVATKEGNRSPAHKEYETCAEEKGAKEKERGGATKRVVEELDREEKEGGREGVSAKYWVVGGGRIMVRAGPHRAERNLKVGKPEQKEVRRNEKGRGSKTPTSFFFV